MPPFMRSSVFLLVGLNLAVNAVDVSLYDKIIVALLFTWAWAATRWVKLAPPRWLVQIGALVVAGVLYQEYGTLLSTEVAVPLLMMMVTLKLFETRYDGGYVTVVFLCYLLLLFPLILSQSLTMAVFLAVDFVLITSVLVEVHGRHEHLNWRALFRRVFRLMAHSVPLTVLLFLLFPRLSASLLGGATLPEASTGFDAAVKPGRVAKLAQSNKLAFRASFGGNYFPNMKDLYWRGAVLTFNRDFEWERGVIPLRGLVPLVKPTVGRISQTIMLEPSANRWLFALDWPVNSQFLSDKDRLEMIYFPGQSFESSVDLVFRTQYRVESVGYPSEGLLPDTPAWRTMLQVNGGGRALRKFAAGLKERSQSAREIAAQILDHFRQQDFVYDLEPGTIDSVDRFFFSVKKGFCEHYAAATAMILRLAGVPARVVVGFQGGTPGLFDEYYLITYQDAHAWVEYWDETLGQWARLDPTEVVAPARLQLGGVGYQEAIARGWDGRGLPPPQLLANSGAGEWLRQVGLIWDRAESWWVNLIMQYDFSQQQNLFRNLGFTGVTRFLLWVFLISAMSLIIVLLFWLASSHREKTDPALSLQRRLQRAVQKFGVVKGPQEGPLDFWERAHRTADADLTPLDQIFSACLNWRYGSQELDPQAIKKYYSEIHSWERQRR